MSKSTLSIYDYIQAANTLECSVPAIQAIAEVESNGSGFDSEGRLKILFERHVFHRLTNGMYSRQYPAISNPSPGGYTKNEYARFTQAFNLSKTAAMKSCSWGAFQVMGFNHRLCGFDSVDDFVDSLKTDQGQLKAFVVFITNNALLQKALIKEDWAGVAVRYNGPEYKKNNYDFRLAAAFRRHEDEFKNYIKCVQTYLNNRGFDCGTADGVIGVKTTSAIGLFEFAEQLPSTRKLSRELFEKSGCIGT